jgi:signal transduction histidine kinase/ActR/RegA family two-component response regulator
VRNVLAGTLIVFFTQDAVSALAGNMDDAARTIAHLCQVVAIYFVYKAFVAVALQKPYDLLFRRLQQSADKVGQINKALEQRAEQLRALASELTLTEQRERRRLAQVLHDNLQQMLVAVKMRVKRVKDKASDGELCKTLGGIEELLDQSIAESRSLTVELSPPVLFDRGLVGGLEWLARHFQEKHQLPVAVELDRDAEPAVEAVRIFLFHAARELLFNTVKHARARAARLCLRRLDANLLQLTVADDGQGYRPSGTEGASTLSGFGLFSIRERLELIDGRLDVTSAPGQGTTTVIEVPGAPDRKADAELLPYEPAPALSSEWGSRRQLRVVLADDHPVLRKGLADMLREQPRIDVVGEAQDGQEALELTLQMLPDVVLMDITMPRLTGIDATRLIRARAPTVRVIGLSMHEDVDMASAMREAGAVAYVNKAEAAETLLAAVLQQLEPTCGPTE